MRTHFFAAAAALMICGAPAFAADVAPKASRSASMPYAPAVAAAPNYWGGWYVGAIGGYGTGDAKGGFGGLQLGYDWQWNQLVFGLRTDAALASISHTERASALGVSVSETGKANWIGSTVAKVGYAPAAAPNWLVYGVAGVGYTNVDYDLRVKGLVSGSDSGSDTKVGFTAGAGVAYAFTQHLNLSFEYDWTRFRGDKQHYMIASIPGSVTHDPTTSHLLKAGLNYRF